MERFLYHGTSVLAAESIARDGFRASYNTVGGYGTCTYLSGSAYLALHISCDKATARDIPHRERIVLILRVQALVGRNCLTFRGDLKPKDDYDSGGDATSFGKFCFFNNHHLVPTHTILLQKSSDKRALERQILGIEKALEKPIPRAPPAARGRGGRRRGGLRFTAKKRKQPEPKDAV